MYRRGLIGERKWIEERILCDEIGHWELDFIVSPTKNRDGTNGSKAVLLVGVDTLSKRTLIELLPNRTKQELSRALSAMFDGVAVKTILTDNDIAFTYWKYFEQLLGAPFYFTHPKLRYIVQTDTMPPWFVIHGSNLKFVHWSYKRYLERLIRETYDYAGVPIKFSFIDEKQVKSNKERIKQGKAPVTKAYKKARNADQKK
jgi:hypothetical protein